MNRRKFLIFSTSTGFLAKGKVNNHKSHNEFSKHNSIKGFIVSDAHIGWKHQSQPSVSQQKILCEKIIDYFPDLDLVFDTGDAHHGYLTEDERKLARTQWLDNIANTFHNQIFHYIPGNHELSKGEKDPELTASIFGSISFRPYYAFDYKGIHFVSLPQLLNTIYITDESIEWLKLDLSINRDKTTIIMSHNSIAGTTYNDGQTGYRVIANSSQIMKILDANPQVIAWFHGHNHQYEIVERNSKLFISNGRIGGFNPPKEWGNFGQGHLGGIFFQIEGNELTVKAFSATRGCFLDELGFSSLSKTKKVKTSFNSSGIFNYFLGHGVSTGQTPLLHRNHHIFNGQVELSVSRRSQILNENNDFSTPTKFVIANKEQMQIIGYKIDKRSIKFSSGSDGLFVSNINKEKQFTIQFPSHINRKHKLYKRGSYYRCSDKLGYSLNLRCRGLESIPQLKVTYMADDYSRVIESKRIDGRGSKDDLQYVIAPINKNIEFLHFRFELVFSDQESDFFINSIELKPHLNLKGQNSVFMYNKSSTALHPTCKYRSHFELSPAHHNKVQLKQTGNDVSSWLLKIPNITWQIRNATITEVSAKTYEVIRSTDQFTFSNSIIFVPTTPKLFYVNQFDGIKHFMVSIMSKKVEVKMLDFDPEASILIFSKNGTLSCSGGEVVPVSSHWYKIQNLNSHVNIIYVPF